MFTKNAKLSVSAVELIHANNTAEAATLRLQVGSTVNDKGKETKLFASIRVPGTQLRCKEDCLKRMAKLPTVSVNLPKTDKNATLQITLRPVLSGRVACVIFGTYGGYDVSELCNVPAEECNAVLGTNAYVVPSPTDNGQQTAEPQQTADTTATDNGQQTGRKGRKAGAVS